MKLLIHISTTELRKPVNELNFVGKSKFSIENLKNIWRKVEWALEKVRKPLSTSIACNWTIKWIYIEMWLIFICYRNLFPHFAHIHLRRSHTRMHDIPIHLNTNKMTFSIEWLEKVLTKATNTITPYSIFLYNNIILCSMIYIFCCVCMFTISLLYWIEKQIVCKMKTFSSMSCAPSINGYV